jgi:hypothetical protein
MEKFAIAVLRGLVIGVGISIIMHEYRKARRS